MGYAVCLEVFCFVGTPAPFFLVCGYPNARANQNLVRFHVRNRCWPDPMRNYFNIQMLFKVRNCLSNGPCGLQAVLFFCEERERAVRNRVEAEAGAGVDRCAGVVWLAVVCTVSNIDRYVQSFSCDVDSRTLLTVCVTRLTKCVCDVECRP